MFLQDAVRCEVGELRRQLEIARYDPGVVSDHLSGRLGLGDRVLSLDEPLKGEYVVAFVLEALLLLVSGFDREGRRVELGDVYGVNLLGQRALPRQSRGEAG